MNDIARRQGEEILKNSDTLFKGTLACVSSLEKSLSILETMFPEKIGFPKAAPSKPNQTEVDKKIAELDSNIAEVNSTLKKCDCWSTTRNILPIGAGRYLAEQNTLEELVNNLTSAREMLRNGRKSGISAVEIVDGIAKIERRSSEKVKKTLELLPNIKSVLESIESGITNTLACISSSRHNWE